MGIPMAPPTQAPLLPQPEQPQEWLGDLWSYLLPMQYTPTQYTPRPTMPMVDQGQGVPSYLKDPWATQPGVGMQAPTQQTAAAQQGPRPQAAQAHGTATPSMVEQWAQQLGIKIGTQTLTHSITDIINGKAPLDPTSFAGSTAAAIISALPGLIPDPTVRQALGVISPAAGNVASNLIQGQAPSVAGIGAGLAGGGFNFLFKELLPEGVPVPTTWGPLASAFAGGVMNAAGVLPELAQVLTSVNPVTAAIAMPLAAAYQMIMDHQAEVKEAKANRKVRTAVVTNYDNNKASFDNLYNFFTSNLPKNLQESLSTYGYSDLTKILGPELMSFFTPHQTLTTFPGEGHEWYNAKPNGPFGRFERVGPLWMSSSSALRTFADKNTEGKYIQGAIQFAQKYGSDPRLGQGTAPLEQMDMLSKEKPLLEYADPNSPKYVGADKIRAVYKMVGDWENPQPSNEVDYYEIPGVGRFTSLYTASPYEQFMNTMWPMIGWDNNPITPEGWDKLASTWSTFTGRPKEEADPFQFRMGVMRWQKEESEKAAAQLEDEQARRFAESGAMF